MRTTKDAARFELRHTMRLFLFTSQSQQMRIELGGLIEDMYLADFIERPEYLQLMSEVA